MANVLHHISQLFDSKRIGLSLNLLPDLMPKLADKHRTTHTRAMVGITVCYRAQTIALSKTKGPLGFPV